MTAATAAGVTFCHDPAFHAGSWYFWAASRSASAASCSRHRRRLGRERLADRRSQPSPPTLAT